MSLVRAERRRLFKRRFTRWMLVIGIAILAMVVVGEFFSNQKIGPEAARRHRPRPTSSSRRRPRPPTTTGPNAARRTPTASPILTTSSRPTATRSGPDAGPVHGRELPSVDVHVPHQVHADRHGLRRAAGPCHVHHRGVVRGCRVDQRRHDEPAALATPPAAGLLHQARHPAGGAFAIGVVLAALWTAAFWAIATVRGSTTQVTPGTWQSIAVSLDVPGATRAGQESRHWDTATRLAARIVPWQLEQPVGTALNLNVPDRTPDDLAGFRQARLAPYGQTQLVIRETGESFVRIAVRENDRDQGPDNDLALLRAGYATLTPIRSAGDADLTLPSSILLKPAVPR